MVPVPTASARGNGSARRPVLALAPAAGDVDLLVASELMEAGRAIAGGYTAPDRTLAIASTSRSYLVVEKMALSDGRYDPQRLIAAVEKNSRQALLLDFEALARQSNAMINAVLLGAIAGARALPIPAEAFEAAIRADGKAVEANLRGFRAGWNAATAGSRASAEPAKRQKAPVALTSNLEIEIAAMPAAAQDIIVEGVRRLTPYQDRDYARLYLDRLNAIREIDDRASTGGRLLAATARQLALRMSYEDVIRVAAAKIDPARLERITRELAVEPGQTVAVTEFLKPGIDELCSILPPWLAIWILKLAERYPALGRLHLAMAVNSRSISGYLRFATLAKLRPFRRKTFRFQKEQEAIEAWLRLIVQAAARSGELAIEIAECAGLIKGYGDTHRRGSGNYDQIVKHIATPALADAMPLAQAIDGIANARAAALLDPEGEALAKCIAGLANTAAHAIAAE
jgi:indolepyruvate ferredoxin oxidoreductase beta subunit